MGEIENGRQKTSIVCLCRASGFNGTECPSKLGWGRGSVDGGKENLQVRPGEEHANELTVIQPTRGRVHGLVSMPVKS